MKVLFITREDYHLSGARVRCHNFCRELIKHGIEARVFSFADDLGAKCGEEELKMSIFKKMSLAAKAFRLLKEESPDTIFILQRLNYHALAPLWVSKLKKNKVVFDCDDWNIRENPIYRFGFYPSSKMEYATRQTAKHAKACVAASRFLESYLLNFNPAVHYLPTGVDTELFCPKEDHPGESVVFSWIGTAYHEEMGANLRFLLDCFSEVADRQANVSLSLAGEGKHFEKVRQTLSGYKHKHRVTVHAWIHPDKIPEHLAQADIGLLPLIQDTKFNKAKSPTKLFEYMSMAKPTIASDTGEARNILRDRQTGFLAKNKNEFVSAMCCLSENRQARREMGDRAREDVERYYSLDVLGRALADALKGL